MSSDEEVSMSEILSYLNDQQDAMVSMLRDWVNQDSPTSNKRLVDQMGRKIANASEQLGGRKVIHSQSETGDPYTLT